MLALISELGLQKYPQFFKGIFLFLTNTAESPQQFPVPETEYVSYLLAGGIQILIDTLAEKLNLKTIQYNTKVITITEVENKLTVETLKGEKLFWNAVQPRENRCRDTRPHQF